MQIISLGKIAPATPGTPVQLTADDTLLAQSVCVRQIGGTTGRVLFGQVGMNKTTLAGAIATFLPPAASGFLDEFEKCSPGGNQIQLSKYAVDADTAAEGLLVSYVVV